MSGTPILHAEASFIGFIAKLTIFIFKQLKRPAAFSVVQLFQDLS